METIPGGRYHLVERLSAGAIGAVYMGLDTVLDRPVAVKSVRLDTPFADHSPDELRERFVREARVAARLQHPNIVTIHDIVATAERGYIIMEFIEGQSLEALLKSKKRLPLSLSIRIMRQLASALDYAHERNVVHRDVKPSNILVSSSSSVWVTDFGVAKSELSTNLTMAGGVLGTPDYMSPEQARGEDVDARSDLFSLGCILFECATGEKPFRSPSLTGVLLSIINDEPVFPLNWNSLGLPVGLKPILHHALEKKRDKRFSSGAELVEALSRLPAEDVSRADELAPEAGDRPVSKESASSPDRASVPPAALEVESDSDAAANDTLKVPAELAPPSTDSSPRADTSQEAASLPERDVDVAEDASAELHVGPAPDVSSDVNSSADHAPAAGSSPDSGGSVAAASDASPRPDGSSSLAGAVAAAGESVWAEVSTERAPGPGDRAAKPQQPASGVPSMEVFPAERVNQLKQDKRSLKLSPTLSGELHGVEITPEEGFLLSRIDGVSRASDIMAMSPLPEAETARVLSLLLTKGLVHQGAAQPPPPVSRALPTNVHVRVDPSVEREIDHLLALAASGDHTGLLGISMDAPAPDRKSAYLRLVGKFHPDKFSSVTDEAFKGKLSKLVSAASQAVQALADAKKMESALPPTSRAPSKERPRVQPVAEDTKSFDKRHYARTLYDRALRAFDLQDFWETIQLCKQAIAADDSEAQYYFLRARALMQNRKWRKDAVKDLRKAAELDASNLEYLGTLAAVYQAEGLNARAASLLKQVHAIDPEYTPPELDGGSSTKP
ncbi:MAG TPA: protein kinase [Vicinamibacteria bacterium]|nr:protein kinase [Vicinamibacteria bacterium]